MNKLALSCIPGYRPGGMYSMECVPINPIRRYTEESIAAKTYILNYREILVIGTGVLLTAIILTIYLIKQRRNKKAKYAQEASEY